MNTWHELWALLGLRLVTIGSLLAGCSGETASGDRTHSLFRGRVHNQWRVTSQIPDPPTFILAESVRLLVLASMHCCR